METVSSMVTYKMNPVPADTKFPTVCMSKY